jgi:hypothetical protein
MNRGLFALTMPAILEQPPRHQMREIAELVRGVRDLCCTILQRAGLSSVSACDG